MISCYQMFLVFISHNCPIQNILGLFLFQIHYTSPSVVGFVFRVRFVDFPI